MPSPHLTRTCAVCGLQKPLAAFLQISGEHGTLYGNICAACRGSGRTIKNPKLSDEKEKGGASLRIGSKEKIYAEKDQRQKIKDIKELFNKEAKRREALTQQKLEATEEKEKERKEKLFLDPKQGFLAKNSLIKESNRKESVEATTVKKAQDIREMMVENIKMEDALRQEIQMTTADLAVPYIEPQTWHLRYHGEHFLRFKAWLGTSSPIVTALERLQTHGKKLSESHVQNKPQAAEPSPPKKEILEDFIEKRLGPGKKR